MNRARLVIVAGVTMLVLGVGIAVVATQDASNNGAAADTGATAPDTVSVSGTGKAAGVPDTLIANLRVHVSDLSSIQTAMGTSAADARAVIGALRGHGVAASDIKTTGLSLNPHYDDHGNVTGYDSGESLTVHLHPLSKAGDILSAVTRAARNDSLTIDGISLGFEDETALLGQARQAAFANAKAAASQYADLGGRTLGAVKTIRAVVHNPTPTYAKGLDFAASAGGTVALPSVPIRAGQKSVSVTVKVVWALS
jgi:uncharacterized protein YggE